MRVTAGGRFISKNDFNHGDNAIVEVVLYETEGGQERTRRAYRPRPGYRGGICPFCGHDHPDIPTENLQTCEGCNRPVV